MWFQKCLVCGLKRSCLQFATLNREQTYKRSLRQKSKRAAMDDDYMIQVLSSSFLDLRLDSSHLLCQAYLRCSYPGFCSAVPESSLTGGCLPIIRSSSGITSIITCAFSPKAVRILDFHCFS